MFTSQYVKIDLPEAQDLADLTGICQDFKFALDSAARLRERYIREDLELAEHLTTAGLVYYARPFLGGVRSTLKKSDLPTMSSKQNVYHEKFLAWRNKHIAHSVNVFEDNQPIARYMVERFHEEGFTSVDCLSQRVVAFSRCDVEMLIELTTYFQEEIQSRIKLEAEKVLKIIKSWPKERILAMEIPSVSVDEESVTKVRRNEGAKKTRRKK